MIEHGPAVLLRVAFDTLDQLARHLHLIGDAALLFVRDQRERFTPGEQLLVGLDIRDAGQQTALRAEVVARAEGALRGAWLHSADTRLARHLRGRGAFAVPREPRISVTDQLVQIRGESGAQVVGHLLDASAGGLRVKRVRGLSAGEACTVRLIGLPALEADLGRARVTRTDGVEAGLQFDTPGALPVLRYLRSLQELWRQAPSLEHPADCCGPRGALEPDLPMLRIPRRA